MERMQSSTAQHERQAGEDTDSRILVAPDARRRGLLKVPACSRWDHWR